MFFYYWIRNIGQLFILVHEIYLFKYYSKNICIMSSTHRRAISCHLFQCHVLLIRNTKFQPDIPLSKFLGLSLYQEHCPSEGDVVLAPRVSCSPGRKYGTSSIYSCSFTIYSCLKIFCKDSVSRSRPVGGRFRATSSSILFSWYRIRNIGQLFLLDHEIYLSISITWRTSVSRVPPIGGRSHATSSSVIFSW